MSQHIKILRRLLPHISVQFEASLFRCSLAPGGRGLFTSSTSNSLRNWEGHNNDCVNSRMDCFTPTFRNIFTSPPVHIGEEVSKGEEGGDEVTQNGNDDQDLQDNATKEAEVAKPGRGTSRGRAVNRGYLKDRTKVIPVEVSMRYLKSSAYKETYGDNLVWVLYRRNFRGQFAPKKTRRTCIRAGQISTGNACPICRDEYLVLHPENVDLLKQFISPFNGEILHYSKTGVCQLQHEKLLVAVKQAKDLGLITFDVPFRNYDYSEYQKLYESYRTS